MPKIEDPKNYTNIGEQYVKEASKTNNDTVNVHELSTEMHKNYMNNLIEAVKRGKSKFGEDFYIVVLTKPERLIKTTLQNYFAERLSCPTPNYDQTVYKFNYKDEDLTFLWVVPSKKICNQIYFDRFNLKHSDDPLIPYIVDFMEGNLYRKALILNKEIHV